MKKLIAIVATLLVSTLIALPAIASAAPAPKATGSIVMSSPLQAASFEAFATSPVKGNVRYTNFELAAPGSGVWVPSGAFNVGFTLTGDSTVYTHAFTIDSVTPVSPQAVSFTGTGVFTLDPSWTDTIEGTVSGTSFSFTMVEHNDSYGSFNLTASGTIAPDGSITGVWFDDFGGFRTGAFSTGPAAVYEVFSYAAPVTSASVSGTAADFTFLIPVGVPYAGTLVSVHVTDGGSPGAVYDTWSHNGTGYPITAGNLVVHT